MPLTVVSYNMHSGIGHDGQFDLDRVAEVLREINADVIALQECGDFQGKTGHDQHPEALATSLGLKMAFGPNVVRDARRYGNAILSKFPISFSKNYDLTVARREPRGALRCDLDVGLGAQLHVFCLHLGLRVHERRAQEAQLLSADIFHEAQRQAPLIVCGDFNYWRCAPVPAMVRHSIHDVALMLRKKQRTYPAKLPFLRLDRMFVDHGIHPLSINVHRSAAALKTSDHLPLVMSCDIRISSEMIAEQEPKATAG